MADSLAFRYHDQIIEQFPLARAGVILAQGLENGPSPGGLKEAFFQEQRAALDSIGETPLSELPTLSAWRGAFRKFGINPTKYRSAAEALLRRLTKKGDVPSINTLVDIGNLVSIRYRLPVAVFDVAQLAGGITVHIADGTERFTPLFETEVEHPEVGEVVFSDPTGLVVARRWCWRQSDESAARPGTQAVVICTESQHEGGQVDVENALSDLVALIGKFAGGDLVTGFVGPERSALGEWA
ncbi:B3/4 domain-containing protein [Chloroflexota bacterium]